MLQGIVNNLLYDTVQVNLFLFRDGLFDMMLETDLELLGIHVVNGSY